MLLDQLLLSMATPAHNDAVEAISAPPQLDRMRSTAALMQLYWEAAAAQHSPASDATSAVSDDSEGSARTPPFTQLAMMMGAPQQQRQQQRKPRKRVAGRHTYYLRKVCDS